MLQKRKSTFILSCLILSLVTEVFCPASGQVVQAAGKGKTLIIYFTRGDNVQSKQQLDATSSASINISSKRRIGNAELVAKKIKKQMGGTLFSIKVKNKYTNSYAHFRL